MTLRSSGIFIGQTIYKVPAKAEEKFWVDLERAARDE
jgi:hypothetical protein